MFVYLWMLYSMVTLAKRQPQLRQLQVGRILYATCIQAVHFFAKNQHTPFPKPNLAVFLTYCTVRVGLQAV